MTDEKYIVTLYYRGLVLENAFTTFNDALEHIKCNRKVGCLNLKKTEMEVKKVKLY